MAGQNKGSYIEAETPNGWAVQQNEQGTQTSVIFNMKDGPFGVALNNNDLGRFMERIFLEISTQTTAQNPALQPENVTENPIPAHSLSFVPHPQDNTSVILALAFGDLQISFMVDSTMLVSTCMRVVANSAPLPDKLTKQ